MSQSPCDIKLQAVIDLQISHKLLIIIQLFC